MKTLVRSWMIVVATSMLSASALAQNLSLEQYLLQVNDNDPGLKAAQSAQSAAQDGLRNSELLTALRWTALAQRGRDARPTLQPTFQGERTLTETYALGLTQQSAWGAKWTLSQYWARTELQGANLMLPTPLYYDFYPKLELTLPLMRNFWGGETQNQVDQAYKQSEAQYLNRKMELVQRKNLAEQTYWRLANVRERLQIQKNSLDRAERLYSSYAQKATRNLTDESDVYQAMAAVQSRKLDLVQTGQELEEIQKKFNLLRSKPASEVPEQLEFAPVDLAQVKFNANQLERADFGVQKKSSQARWSGAQAQKSAALPNLDLTGQIIKQGRSVNNYSDANSSFRDGTYDAWFVGVQFSAPLDFTLIRDARRSAEADMASSEAEQIKLDRESADATDDFINQGKMLSSSLDIVRQLETVQLKKTEEERKKLNTGRTVLAQVLLFEQDYANTRTQRLNLELQTRQWLSQRSLFFERSQK